jgi:hypothetical protein
MKKEKFKSVCLGKAMSFGEMIEGIKARGEALEKYVKETGLCCACKKNPVEGSPDPLRCKECVDETERLLKQLRGPGFMEMRLGTKK